MKQVVEKQAEEVITAMRDKETVMKIRRSLSQSDNRKQSVDKVSWFLGFWKNKNN